MSKESSPYVWQKSIFHIYLLKTTETKTMNMSIIEINLLHKLIKHN